jgi:hypothetical protein
LLRATRPGRLQFGGPFAFQFARKLVLERIENGFRVTPCDVAFECRRGRDRDLATVLPDKSGGARYCERRRQLPIS